VGQRKGRNFILWLDLECTGSGDDEDILEIGIALSDKELNVIDTRSIVLPMMPDKLETMAEVVVKMHTVNNLISDSMGLGFYSSEMDKSMQLAQIDEELSRWVKQYAGGDHVPLAGSGISHYDRKYIKRDLPLFNKRLTYYSSPDVGDIRRSLELCGIEWGDFHFTKTHRALDDALQHLEEFRRFKSYMQRAARFLGAKV
jgi:oligoribonuclease (3'-5' exoribonuclease)